MVDLAEKSLLELHQLSHFTRSLLDDLRAVDDTEVLRCELAAFADTIDLVVTDKARRI